MPMELTHTQYSEITLEHVRAHVITDYIDTPVHNVQSQSSGFPMSAQDHHNWNQQAIVD